MKSIPHPDVIPGIAYPSKSKILEEVCNEYSIPVMDLYKRTRERKISEPRMLVMALLKSALDWTNDEISLEFQITNASVVHGRKTIQDLYLTNKSKKELIDRIASIVIPSDSIRAEVIKRMIDPEMDKSKTKHWKLKKNRKLLY